MDPGTLQYLMGHWGIETSESNERLHSSGDGGQRSRDGRDGGRRAGLKRAGEDFRGSRIKRDDTENVHSNLNGRVAALHLRVEGFSG